MVMELTHIGVELEGRSFLHCWIYEICVKIARNRVYKDDPYRTGTRASAAWLKGKFFSLLAPRNLGFLGGSFDCLREPQD
jgi:hypothetical protein